MYFSLIPNIEYDTKPIKFPFKSADYVTAKNFFRRFKINQDVFNYTIGFRKYAVLDGERPDQVADKFYDEPMYDWVLLLTNNVINPLFDWPKSSNALRKYCETTYTDPYATILYYETNEVNSGDFTFGDDTGKRLDIIVQEKGLKVDETFYNSPFTYYDGTNNITVPGSTVCHPISAYEHEEKENEKRREIWILKERYVERFVDEFKASNFYKESSDFISLHTKKTGR